MRSLSNPSQITNKCDFFKISATHLWPWAATSKESLVLSSSDWFLDLLINLQLARHQCCFNLDANTWIRAIPYNLLLKLWIKAYHEPVLTDTTETRRGLKLTKRWSGSKLSQAAARAPAEARGGLRRVRLQLQGHHQPLFAYNSTSAGKVDLKIVWTIFQGDMFQFHWQHLMIICGYFVAKMVSQKVVQMMSGLEWEDRSFQEWDKFTREVPLW